MHKLWLIALLILAALWIGWSIGRPTTTSQQDSKTATRHSQTAPQPQSLITGDPVDRFRACTSQEEKLETIGRFMALGHDRNAQMLIDALKDPSTDLRVKALEYAASLEPGVSALVLKEACLNDAKDVREMGWSLLAPHPLMNKAPVLIAAVEHSSDSILEEVFIEMGRTPEKPLFEAMLAGALRAQAPARQSRTLTELQAWLKPGGGDTPAFQSINQLADWWAANQRRYDTYMLRVDL